MTSPTLLQQMQEILQTEIEHYRRMHELSIRQAEALKPEHPVVETIAQLMQEKLQIADALQYLEEEHQPVKEQWKQEYQQYSEAEREPIAQMRDTLIDLLEELSEMENQITGQIQSCAESIQEQLGQYTQQKNTSKAYVHSKSYTERDVQRPRFFDKRQ